MRELKERLAGAVGKINALEHGLERHLELVAKVVRRARKEDEDA